MKLQLIHSIGRMNLILLHKYILYLSIFNSEMSLQQKISFILLLLCSLHLSAQYHFSGKVTEEYKDGNIYLSLVEDYRKISGVHPEQILNKTRADTSGIFKFQGDNLTADNKIYRIHIDLCTEEEQQTSHFTGHCLNSKEIVFVANNTTRLELPFGFENEMFCRIVSADERTNAFLKIDSLKNDMRFAFGTYRSEANRKINSKKWFNILQLYGEQLNEPLAELYSYTFLSDRSSALHAYYVEDLKSSNYYDNLLYRLETRYPNSSYTSQYKSELTADKMFLAPSSTNTMPWWGYLVSGIACFSLFGNFYFSKQLKKTKQILEKKQPLSAQEQKVLNLILEEKTNKEIASKLFVSVSTVKSHINSLYKKLGVRSRAEVIGLK